MAVNKPTFRPICSELEHDSAQIQKHGEVWVKSDTKPASQGPKMRQHHRTGLKYQTSKFPLRYISADRLRVPGHIRLTDSPHRELPKRDIMGIFIKTATA